MSVLLTDTQQVIITAVLVAAVAGVAVALMVAYWTRP